MKNNSSSGKNYFNLDDFIKATRDLRLRTEGDRCPFKNYAGQDCKGKLNFKQGS